MGRTIRQLRFGAVCNLQAENRNAEMRSARRKTRGKAWRLIVSARSMHCGAWRMQSAATACELERQIESNGGGQTALIAIERNEMGRTHDPSGGNMENVEATMPAGEGMGGRELKRVGQNVGEVALSLDEAALTDGLFEKQLVGSCFTGPKYVPTLCKTQRVDQFETVERTDGDRQ